MARFPLRRSDRDVLYESIVAGVVANPADYPSGPGQPFDLTTFSAMLAAKATAVINQDQDMARARASTKEAVSAYDACDEEAKRLLNMAAAIHGRNSPKLRLIGSGPRKDAKSLPPSQPRALEIAGFGPKRVTLDWKAPAKDGGKPAFYKVIRQIQSLGGGTEEEWGKWQTATIASEIELTDLSSGHQYDFAVIAVNAAGESTQSNIVTLVL